MKPGKGLLILGKPMGKPMDKEEDEDKPKGKGRLSAAKAVLRAIESDDAEGLDEALKLHYSLCSHDSEEDDSEEDDY